MRMSRWLLALALSAVALGAAAWLFVSIGEMHDRLARHSGTLALVFLAIVGAVAVVSAAAAARLFWVVGRPEPRPITPPEDVIRAAEVQAQEAEGVITKVRDESVRADLNAELATLRVDRERRRFHVVVFGTGSAGKTSLINALLGRNVGATEAVMGTTRHGEEHTHTLEGVEGTVLLTDTPGLSEFGQGGAMREAEARDLAARADLLLFVVDHDLIRAEYEPLTALARQGKRSIVVLNKVDRLVDQDRDAILEKLRERLTGIVPRDDVVPVAAAPRPTLVRVTQPDGSVQTVYDVEPPDLGALEDRIAAILRREGDVLRAGNLLLRAHLLGKKAQEQIAQERRERAQAVVDKFQWITAGTVFTNPIPALDLLANGAVQLQMISEIATVYGVEITSNHVRMIGLQMIQTLLKLGMVEAATSLIAGLFKSSFVGYAAGGAVQAVSMAYLTHIAGQTFIEYFAHGQSWGDGGMQAALVRQFDLNSRAEFLQEFAKQAIARVLSQKAKAGRHPAGKGS
ncbi:MAG: GTP-binding protein [Planctomycetaceae bacterium]|nr:GTP-binding protein [Planctomycetaceae bacterium]